MPLLVNGRLLKALNHHYNQQRASLQARVPPGRFTARHVEVLTDKRQRQIDHDVHVASRRIIDALVEQRIGTLVIGKNDGGKQGLYLGRRTNQAFVFLPHARFIERLTSTAHLVGIAVLLTEQGHTSTCSFLDGEAVGHHEGSADRRIKRGVFVSATGPRINAAVHGAYNRITKVVPNAVGDDGDGSVGVVVHPVGLALRNREHAA